MAGSPLAAQSRELCAGAGLEAVVDPSIMSVDLTRSGELDRAKVHPVAKPLRRGPQVDRRGHVDPAVQITSARRLEEGRLHVELLQSQALLLAVQPGHEGCGITEGQCPGALRRGQVGQIGRRMNDLPACGGITRDIGTERDSPLVDPDVITQMQRSGNLPGQGSKVEVPFQVPTAIARRRVRARCLDGPDRRVDIKAIGRPGSVPPIHLAGKANGLEMELVSREALPFCVQVKQIRIACQGQVPALLLDLDRSSEGPTGRDLRAGVDPGPAISLDRQLEVLGNAAIPFLPAHAPLDLDRSRRPGFARPLQRHSPGDGLRKGVQVEVDIGLVGEKRVVQALAAEPELAVDNPDKQRPIRLVLQDRLEGLEQVDRACGRALDVDTGLVKREGQGIGPVQQDFAQVPAQVSPG